MKPTYCVFNKTAESFLGLNISCADTTWARLKGLLGKFSMSSDEGLWVVPSRGIHTIGMLIPIDLVYLDAEHRVVHLVEHLGSLRLGPICWKSTSVLELPPHTIYASHTRVGDELLICLPEQMETYLNQTNPAV
ncbi:MAG TPA: DUF192 domain-containing protein [Bryobacteraceae bacterium]|jgi:uncharacterized membrane protein (UPF0127 family)